MATHSFYYKCDINMKYFYYCNKDISVLLSEVLNIKKILTQSEMVRWELSHNLVHLYGMSHIHERVTSVGQAAYNY